MNRIAKWDNIKFWMIFCVVIGHVLYRIPGESNVADGLYLFIYTFHMPVFVFVAGLFAKKTIQENRIGKIVEFLFIYVFMKALEAVGSYLSTGNFTFHLFWENGPAWFAFAIAVFFAATMLIKNMPAKWVLLAALFLGCVAGLDTHLGDHFVSMRICVFYPVFLLGYYVDPHKLDSSRFKSGSGIAMRMGSLAIIATVFVACMMYSHKGGMLLKMLKGKYEFAEMDMGPEGVGYRLACYVFWAIMIIAIVFAVGEKQRIHTWIGERSLNVYIWHILFIDVFLRKLDLAEIMVEKMPAYYPAAAICVALIITVLAAYLPAFRANR